MAEDKQRSPKKQCSHGGGLVAVWVCPRCEEERRAQILERLQALEQWPAKQQAVPKGLSVQEVIRFAKEEFGVEVAADDVRRLFLEWFHRVTGREREQADCNRQLFYHRAVVLFTSTREVGEAEFETILKDALQDHLPKLVEGSLICEEIKCF